MLTDRQQKPDPPSPALSLPGVPPVVVTDVTCTYRDYVAVSEASFTVHPGQIHALLGTNGAGKTTLLESIQGFHRPASGTLSVLGHDPWKHRSLVAGRTGTMLQESGLVDEMTVVGQLSLWQGLSMRDDSIDRVLDVVGLEHRARIPVAVLSGGERRRLDFAMAIWGDPELLILDEPTTGLDPQSRRAMWEVIRELNARGSTVLITTHYLDEAQSLADHVTILDRGRVAVQGPMREILGSLPAHISFTVDAPRGSLTRLSSMLSGELETSDSDYGTGVAIKTAELSADIGVVSDWSRSSGTELRHLRCSPASLEEVFFGMSPAASPKNQQGHGSAQR